MTIALQRENMQKYPPEFQDYSIAEVKMTGGVGDYAVKIQEFSTKKLQSQPWDRRRHIIVLRPERLAS